MGARLSSRAGPDRGIPAIGLAVAVVVFAIGIAVVGCGRGPAGTQPPRPTVLLEGGGRAPRPSSAAFLLARRFARIYADDAYRRRPLRLVPESDAVNRELLAAGSRVPTARRGLRPRLLGLRLSLLPRGSVRGSALIGDGRFPPFSVGFTVGRRGGRWLVTSIALPD